MEEFQQDYKFCPKCSHKLNQTSEGQHQRLTCSFCGFIYYRNPVPAAGAIILRENKLLLVKRKYPPQKNMWCIPAGFMEFDETPEDCCIREIKEETGLDIRIKSTFRNYPGHDDPRAKVVLLIYKAEVIGGNPMAGDDAVDLDFFALDKIPTDIAFEAHKMAIADLRKSLENEIFFNDGIIHGG